MRDRLVILVEFLYKIEELSVFIEQTGAFESIIVCMSSGYSLNGTVSEGHVAKRVNKPYCRLKSAGAIGI